LLRQQQRQLQAAVQQAGSCPASNVPDKGLQFANVSEVVPYGIEMVEATAPEMIEISKQYRSKVLFCVIDSGERQYLILQTSLPASSSKGLDACCLVSSVHCSLHSCSMQTVYQTHSNGNVLLPPFPPSRALLM
jgi:hypothetical protein